MAGQRKLFVGGNWKMNGNKESIDGLVKMLNEGGCTDSTDVVVAPSTIYLDYVRQKLDKRIGVAAQNCYKAEKGAFTGDIREARNRTPRDSSTSESGGATGSGGGSGGNNNRRGPRGDRGGRGRGQRSRGGNRQRHEYRGQGQENQRGGRDESRDGSRGRRQHDR